MSQQTIQFLAILIISISYIVAMTLVFTSLNKKYYPHWLIAMLVNGAAAGILFGALLSS